jgi:hypothetical protein
MMKILLFIFPGLCYYAFGAKLATDFLAAKPRLNAKTRRIAAASLNLRIEIEFKEPAFTGHLPL